MRALKIREVFIGKVEEITGESAVQQRLDGEVWLGSEGLPGDTLGRRHHPGDSDRALLHYPAAGLHRHWRKRFAFNKWRPAACGDNFSAFGLLEEAVCVGDLWRWGEALLEVSQPHLPDYRLAQRWNLPELPRLLQDSGRCGWYYRVLRPGPVSVEAPLTLVQRHYPLLQRGAVAALVRPPAAGAHRAAPDAGLCGAGGRLAADRRAAPGQRRTGGLADAVVRAERRRGGGVPYVTHWPACA